MKPISKRTKLLRLGHLLRVAEECAAKPKRAFDMRTWGRRWDEDDGQAPPCGTSACLGGWAGLDPWFRRQGLRTKIGKWDTSITCVGRTARGSNYFALETFFGLDWQDGERMFAPSQYGAGPGAKVPARRVVARVKKIIREVEAVA